jgi:hypothetical protein
MTIIAKAPVPFLLLGLSISCGESATTHASGPQVLFEEEVPPDPDLPPDPPNDPPEEPPEGMVAEVEAPASPECLYDVTWFRGGHLQITSQFTQPAVCWGYPDGSSVQVSATYAMQSGAGHFNGEEHRWYVVALDHAGNDGTPLLVASYIRNADQFYTDTFQVPVFGEASRVYLATQADQYDPFNFWIYLWTNPSTPVLGDPGVFHYPHPCPLTLSWTNAEVGTRVFTEIWFRSLWSETWQQVDLVESGVSAWTDPACSGTSTGTYVVRHRHRTHLVQAGIPIIRLGEPSNTEYHRVSFPVR